MNQYPVSRWDVDSQGKSAYSSFTDFVSYGGTEQNHDFLFQQTTGLSKNLGRRNDFVKQKPS
jgi:hypothetical protein